MSEPQRQSGPREVIVGEGHEGQRVDNFLITELKGVPKTRIYRILRKGEVRVNKGRIKPDYRLQSGDVVRIPPIRVAEEAPAPKPGHKTLENIAASVIYEDDALLILNKPSGIAVHGGSGLSYGIIEALRVLRPEAPFLELGHRLDRETSGCLVIAKKRSALRAFQSLLREGDKGGMEKIYLALVKGRWKGGTRRVKAALEKNTLSSGERMVRVSEEGKEALSIFEPVTIYTAASLMRVSLITGRTHQVRVHARHTGHPIAGDDKYGDDDFNKQMAQLGLKRLFLHAHRLRFTLPMEKPRVIDVEAPLAPELEALLHRLDETKT
jgi:23S rRNA pseudouridine955/2504/2580 synthase